uniref:Uncharacterized protein n=1 Tax=Anguilla anguilla TaxID=7936 RepID=A0A0E9RLX6_ANGAN
MNPQPSPLLRAFLRKMTLCPQRKHRVITFLGSSLKTQNHQEKRKKNRKINQLETEVNDTCRVER